MLKHGGSDIYNIKELVQDYSVTTNYLGPCANGLDCLSKNVNSINHYPTENKNFFKEGLEFLNVNHTNVLWGNGASELIDLSIRTLVNNFNYLSFAKYNSVQYMEYERCCLNNGLKLSPNNADILLIINPNNPTGDFFRKNQLKPVINSLKEGSTVIIDESMIFWIGSNWLSHSFLSEKEYILNLKKNRNINVILIQSWTKIFSCTGLRFGSLVCFDEDLIKDFETYKTPWSANILAYHYLKGCLADKKYLETTWDQTPVLRKIISNNIMSIFPFAQVKGHDFLSWLWVDFKIESLANTIYNTSLEFGIPVRHGKMGYNCNTFIRFAVRNMGSNEILFDMLNQVKNQMVKIPNYYFKVPHDLVYGIVKIPLEIIKSHEEHILERKNKLISYLNENDYFVLPSIIIDANNLIILDGHHRLNILKELGVKEEYVLLVNYNSDSIIPHETNQITKSEIIQAGISGKLLPPKSSKHIFIDLDKIKRPLVSLSVLINN
jgi:histidinol-phosphate/aromatic aminotransferase/cobyric acid decarboxylase-like protein